MKVWEAILQKESIQTSELSQLIPLNRFFALDRNHRKWISPTQNKGSQTFLKLIFSFGTILIQMEELQMNELEKKKTLLNHLLEHNVKHFQHLSASLAEIQNAIISIKNSSKDHQNHFVFIFDVSGILSTPFTNFFYCLSIS